MSAAFWIGLATLAALAIILTGCAWLLVGARKAWHAMHTHLLWQRVELRADPRPVRLAPWHRTKGAGEPSVRTYEQEANRIRDALVHVPRMRLIAGLGWYVAIIRDFKNEPTDHDDRATDVTT